MYFFRESDGPPIVSDVFVCIFVTSYLLLLCSNSPNYAPCYMTDFFKVTLLLLLVLVLNARLFFIWCNFFIVYFFTFQGADG